MTPDNWQALKDRIAAGKVRPDRVHAEYAYQRAWNDALAWVEEQMKAIEGGKND